MYRGLYRNGYTWRIVKTSGMILGILAWLYLGTAAGADDNGAYRRLIEREQRILRVRGASARSLRAELNRSAGQVVAGGSAFLVIRPAKDATITQYEALLAKLGRDRRVTSIAHDHLVYPLGAHDQGDDGQGNDGQGNDGKTLSVTRAIDPGAQPPCRLGRSCGEDGVNPAWPRHRLGAPLAEKIVAKFLDGQPNSMAGVTVIDTGFNKEAQAKQIEAASFTTGKGHDAAGDPNADTDGHGTAVCGMIAGREVGITRHVHLGFLRVTEPNANGQTSEAFLAASIEKACQQSAIVNVSWGSLNDEIADAPIENTLWYKQAVARGCLIIKAAGNSGVKRRDRREIPLASPYLTVAASNLFDDEAGFSTDGSLRAPGEGVFSLLANFHFYGSATSANSCDVDPAHQPPADPRAHEVRPRLGQINGTSFSSPIVAAIAGQVLGVLNARSTGGQLDPKRRVVLIKKVLLASQAWAKRAGEKSPGVGSLTAVLIASRIPLDNDALDTDAILKITQESPELKERCAAPSRECPNEPTCDRKKECAEELSFKILACQPPPEGVAEDKTVLPKLFRTYVHLQEPDLALRLVEKIPAGDSLLADAQKLWHKSWDGRGDARGDQGALRGMTLLDMARRSAFFDQTDPAAKLESVLQNNRFDLNMRFSQPLGTDPRQSGKEAEADRIFRIFLSLPSDQRLALFDHLPRAFDKFNTDGPLKNSYLNFLYYMHEHESELPADLKARLKARLADLGSRWLDGKIAMDSGGAREMIPAAEMLAAAVPEGFERLRGLFPDPKKIEINDANREKLEVVALSPHILGDTRMEFLNQLLIHPDSKREGRQYFQDRVIDELLRSGTPEMLTGNVRQAFLENPRLDIPHAHDNVPEANLTKLTEGDFYNQLLVRKLERTPAIFSVPGASGAPGDIDRGLADTFTALLTARTWSKPQREAFFAGQGGDLIVKILEQSVQMLAKADSRADSWWAERLYGARQCISWALRSQAEMKSCGFEPKLKGALKAMEADLRANRAKYNENFYQDYARLFALGEKF